MKRITSQTLEKPLINVGRGWTVPGRFNNFHEIFYLRWIFYSPDIHVLPLQTKQGYTYLYSHMTGVIDQKKYSGAGYMMKMKQKEHYNVNFENPQFINYVDGYNLEFVEKAEIEK